MSATRDAAAIAANSAPIASRAHEIHAQPPHERVARPTSSDRWRMIASSGSGATRSATIATAPASAAPGIGRRRAARSQRGGRRTSAASSRSLDQQRAGVERQLRAAVVARAIDLRRREVLSRRVDRGRVEHPAARPQQQRPRHPRRRRRRGPRTAPSAIRRARASRYRRADVRTPCRSPSSPTSTPTGTPSRPCSPTSTPHRRARALVPGRPRRLRRRPQRLRRARARALRRLHRRQPRPRGHGRTAARRLLARRGARRRLDAGGDRARAPGVPARAAARAVERAAGLYHGSPRDPVWEYVVGALLAELCLDRLEQRVGLIGHRHIALSFVRHEGEPADGTARRGGDDARHLRGLVAAEPGQRRPAARRRPARRLAAARHSAPGTASWRRTEYDVAGAAGAIRAARLPDSLAERLGVRSVTRAQAPRPCRWPRPCCASLALGACGGDKGLIPASDAGTIG